MDSDASRLNPQQNSRRIGLKYILPLGIVIGLLIFGAVKLLGIGEEQVPGEETPTPTIVVSTPTSGSTTPPTPTTAVSPTVAGTKTPTPKAGSITPTKKAGELDRSTLTISVLNGSGVSGAAANIAATLRELGYTVSSTGNAETFDYEDVTIQVKSAKRQYLTQLQNDLKSDYTITSATADLAGGSTDAVVIIGK